MIALEGKKVLIRKSLREDVPDFFTWIHDPDVTRYLSPTGEFPKTIEKEYEWFDTTIVKKEEILFTILDKETGKIIGNMGLHQISNENHTAVFGIMIGDKNYWNKGFGQDSIKTLLEYCRTELKLKRMTLLVFPEHTRAIACYEKCGFRKTREFKKIDDTTGKTWTDMEMEIHL